MESSEMPVLLFILYQWSTVKQIPDNEIHLLIKYIKSVLWRVTKRLTYYLYQWYTVKQISDNEIHLLIKYIKSVLWRVAKRLTYYLYQWYTVKQISDNEIYLLIKYIKSVLWRVAKRLSYTEDARCLNINKTVEKMEETRISHTLIKTVKKAL